MKTEVKIIDLFKTSMGEVAILGFLGEGAPEIGMILNNKSNFKWRISGIGGNRKLALANKYSELNFESIWDCNIEPLNHSESVKIDDELEIE
jgi:hypothetical protein